MVRLKILLVLLFSSTICFGQNTKATILAHYTTENGLPQNSVKSIQFDNSGFCWLATELGLVRYDGKIFKQFFDKNLRNLRITRILSDDNNHLFVRMNDETVYQIQVDSFKSSILNSSIKYQDKYIQRGNIVNSEWHRVWLEKIINDENYLLFDENRDYQFACDSTTMYLVMNGVHYLQNKEHATLASLPNIKYYSSVAIDDNLLQISGSKYQLIHHSTCIAWNKDIPQILKNDANFLKGDYRFLWCRQGTFLSTSGKLYQLKVENNEMKVSLVFDDLPNIKPICIYVNPQQDKYYIGSPVNGLYIVTHQQFQIFKTPKNGTEDNVFYSQALVGDKIFANNMLISKDGSVEDFNFKSDNPVNFLNEKTGELWLSNRLGLFTYNVHSHEVENYPCFPKKQLSGITWVEEDSTLYFSTMLGFGRVKYQKAEWIESLKFKSNFINSIYKLNKDTIIIATVNNLLAYSIRTNQFSDYAPIKNVRVIYKDKRGNLWFGTYNNGYWVKHNGDISSLPIDVQKRLSSVHSFIEDNRGLMWMSTNNGLIAVEKSVLLKYAEKLEKEVMFRIFDQSDGLPTNEFNGGCQPSLIQLPDGRYSLPSMDGLIQFDPDVVKIEIGPTQLFLDAVYEGRKQISSNKNLEFSAGVSQITFEFSAPYFGKPEEIYLEYKLDKLSSRWIRVENSNRIEFTGLKHGDYNLMVRMNSKDSKQLEFHFVVLPYYYETWWFYLLIAICLSLFIYRMYKIRLKQIKKRNEDLELIIEQKTIDLNKTIEDLDATIQKLELSEFELSKNVLTQSKMIHLIMHDMKSPLTFIEHAIMNLQQHFAQKNESKVEEDIFTLKEGIESINKFSTSFFEWAFYQQKKLSPTYNSYTLEEIISENKRYFDVLFQANGNVLAIQTSSIKINTDKNMMFTVLRNLLDNANKHTKNGTISMLVKQVDSAILIQVQDTGSTMSMEMIDKIKAASKNTNALDSLSGFGYKIIIEVLDILQGRLEIESSSNGSGTLVTISLNRS